MDLIAVTMGFDRLFVIVIVIDGRGRHIEGQQRGQHQQEMAEFEGLEPKYGIQTAEKEGDHAGCFGLDLNQLKKAFDGHVSYSFACTAPVEASFCFIFSP